METNPNTIITYALMALALLAVPIAILLARASNAALTGIAEKVKAETKAGLKQSAILSILHLGNVAASRVLGKVAPQVRAALADGKVTPEERTGIKNTVLNELRAMLTEEGKDELFKFVGLDDGALGTYLDGIVEKSISEATKPAVKLEAKPVAPPASP